MKFNLFDESTWQNNKKVVDPEIRMRSTVLGHMGNAMRDVRDLRRKIEAEDMFDNDEYKISLVLKDRNPEAYKLMEVSVEFSDANTKYILDQIDSLIEFWSDKERRDILYKQYIPVFRNLEPYLKRQQCATFGDMFDEREKNIKNLVSVKVKGNAAWKMYFEVTKSRDYWMGIYTAKQEEIDSIKEKFGVEDDSTDSYDYSD